MTSIKQRIQTAQIRAAVAVNQELVLLYWGIGKEILARQESEGWGAKFIDQAGHILYNLDRKHPLQLWASARISGWVDKSSGVTPSWASLHTRWVHSPTP